MALNSQQDFPDRVARQIRHNTGLGMEIKSSTLLLNEIILPSRKLPLQMALWDVQMMAVLGRRERTETDWKALVDSVSDVNFRSSVRLEIRRFWYPHHEAGEGIIEIIRRA